MKKILLFVLLSGAVFCASAQWNTDTLVRNAICTAINTQVSPQLCNDGSNGAIITWTDIRSNPSQIYAQRIDSNGVIKWTSNGLLAAAGTIGVLPAYPVSDGSGGAIVVYEPAVLGGETHIHAQRLDANGNAQWGTGGIRLDTISTSRLNNYVAQVIASDGNGGAFICWRHYFFGTDEIRVQHIDHNGNLAWGPQGLAVTNNTTVHYSARVINTGNNTCVVAYEQQGKLLMQRLSSNGTKMWGAADLQITNTLTTITTNNFYLLQTSAKNIAIAWEDTRNGNADIYAQKTDTNGVTQWRPGGTVVDSAAVFTLLPELAADNADGVFVACGFNNVFVQHLDAGGQLRWGNTSKQVSSSSGQTNHHMWADGSNGIVISWEDKSAGPTQRIYAQHYDNNATGLWRPDGLCVAVTGNGGVRANNITMGLNSGRVIAAWEDYRNGTNNQDIYAARFGNNALLKTGFTTANTCLGDSILFTDITSSDASTINFWRWDFGDGSSPSTTKNPKHKYAAKGNYTVTLTLMDNEFNYRVFSQQVSIGNSSTVQLGNDTSICAGSYLILNAANSGAQYLWSTGATTQTITITTAGTYWVKVTNGGCSGADTVVVSTQPVPVAAFSYSASNLNINFSNTSTNAGTYTWLFGDGNSSSTTAPAHNYAAAGNYVVKLFAGNACKTDSVAQTIVIGNTGGTPADSCGNVLSVKLYPNPVEGMLSIRFLAPAATVRLALFNSIGQLMQEYQFNGIVCHVIKQIDMRAMAAGVYMLKITDDKIKLVKKIVKQ